MVKPRFVYRWLRWHHHFYPSFKNISYILYVVSICWYHWYIIDILHIFHVQFQPPIGRGFSQCDAQQLEAAKPCLDPSKCPKVPWRHRGVNKGLGDFSNEQTWIKHKGHVDQTYADVWCSIFCLSDFRCIPNTERMLPAYFADFQPHLMIDVL